MFGAWHGAGACVQSQDCKKSRNFDEADKVREDLKDMGVNVQDKDRTWSVGMGGGGGGYGGGGGGYGGGGGSSGYQRTGDPNAECDVAKIEAMLCRRNVSAIGSHWHCRWNE